MGGNIKYVTRRALAIKSLPRVQPDPRNSKMLPPQQGELPRSVFHDISTYDAYHCTCAVVDL